MLIRFYSAFSSLIAPFILKKLIAKRLSRGKEDPNRYTERFGVPSKKRPGGKLLWIHGASLGETTAALCVVNRFLDTHPSAWVLVTSGTVSSAKMLEKRLPDRAFHQYLPLDSPKWVKAFLEYWRPDAALWVESEIWPNLLSSMKKRGVPTGLINAHLSEKSKKLWLSIPRSAQKIFSCFQVILPQNKEGADFFDALDLAGTNIQIAGNLKFSLPPLSDKNNERERLHSEFAARPFWLAASTHPGEEEKIALVHQQLKESYPDLLTILAPRHPERREEIYKILSKASLKTVCHSQKPEISEDIDIYLVDTFGDLGFLYRLCDIVFLGGSLTDIGGHNLIEPAQLKCAILHGPYMSSQKEMLRLFQEKDAVVEVKNAHEMSQALHKLISSSELKTGLADRALDTVSNQSDVLDNTWEYLTFMSIFEEDEERDQQSQEGDSR